MRRSRMLHASRHTSSATKTLFGIGKASRVPALGARTRAARPPKTPPVTATPTTAALGTTTASAATK